MQKTLTNTLAMALTMVLPMLLMGCSWLAPDMKLPSFGGMGKAVEAPVALPFISPTVVGSWQLLAEVPAPSATAVWYEVLGLEGLEPLVTQALAGNPTLQAAVARTTQAKALADSAFASLLPSVNVQADALRGRRAPVQTGAASGVDVATSTTYDGLLGAAWELDLFGRLSSQTKVAKLNALTRAQLAEATRLSLTAQVARTYVLLLAATNTQQAWQVTLAAAEQRHQRVQARYDAGELDVNAWQGAVSTLQSLRVQALNAAATTRQLHHALAVLVGQPPQMMPLPHADLVAVMAPAPTLPRGPVTAEVVLARPDVRAAVSQFEASLANIGAARAAFFPRLTLSGVGGFASSELGDLFEWNNRTWSAGPTLSLPIFQGGALRANLKRSWGVYEEAVAAYKDQLLRAFGEVADGLVLTQTSRAGAAATQTAWDGQQQAEAAMATRYALGDVSKNELLSVQMNAQQARANHAQASAAARVAAINLMVALGGQR